MNDRAKRALGLVSVPTLVIGVILLASGTPVQVVAEVLFAMFAVFVTCAFIITRFTSDREPVDIEKPSTLGKSQAQITVFGLLAAVTFVVSLQQLVSPAQSTDRTFGIAGVIIALFCAFLAFRAYRKMRSAPMLADPKAADGTAESKGRSYRDHHFCRFIYRREYPAHHERPEQRCVDRSRPVRDLVADLWLFWLSRISQAKKPLT